MFQKPDRQEFTLQESSFVAFLLQELQIMETETQRLRNEGSSRLNFLFTLTSSILGALLALAGLKALSDIQIRSATIASSFVLFVFSVSTYDYCVVRDISSDRNARATGRIRRFFVDRVPEIEKYISWQKDDKPTRWITSNDSHVRRMVLFIASCLLGLCIGMIIFEYQNEFFISLGVGFYTIIFTGIILYVWANKRLRHAVDVANKSQRFSLPLNQNNLKGS